MTVWEDLESLRKFVEGRRHLDAMYMSNQAMKKFRSTHVEVLARDLPISWPEAKKLINAIPYNDHKPF